MVFVVFVVCYSVIITFQLYLATSSQRSRHSRLKARMSWELEEQRDEKRLEIYKWRLVLNIKKQIIFLMNGSKNIEDSIFHIFVSVCLFWSEFAVGRFVWKSSSNGFPFSINSVEHTAEANELSRLRFSSRRTINRRFRPMSAITCQTWYTIRRYERRMSECNQIANARGNFTNSFR